MVLSLVPVSSAVEERGTIASIEQGESLIMDGASFPGFYYSASSGTHYETLMLNFSKDGVVDVGDASYILKISYGSTALLGDKYKVLNAGDTDILLSKSLVSYGKRTLEVGQDYVLGEGYKLILKDMNKDGSMFELQKNSVPVSTRILKEGEKFEYETRINGTKYKTITATVEWMIYGESPTVHVKSVTQYSENPSILKVGDEYGKFGVKSITNQKVELKNTAPIHLPLNGDVSILDDFVSFKVAKGVYTAYPYTESEDVKAYNVRGVPLNNVGSFTWTAENFGAFFYDLEHSASTEQLEVVVDLAEKMIEKGNLVYESVPVKVPFRNPEMMDYHEDYFNDGYHVIGWQGEKYATLGSAGKIARILLDDNGEMILKYGSELDIGEGYTLMMTDAASDTVYLKLLKNTIPVYSSVIKPGKSADIGTHTFLYTRNIAGIDVPIFSVYVSAVFEGDGALLQLKYPMYISDSFLNINAGDKSGNLEVVENQGKLRLENKKSIPVHEDLDVTDDICFDVSSSSKVLFYPYISRVNTGESIIPAQSLPPMTIEQYLIGVEI